ncbi:MAG: type II secretion system protein [Candidatus Paceibacterota bacterium]
MFYQIADIKNKKNRSYSNLTKRGFTLLEMVVSLGLFSFVAVIAVGSLVRITGLNRQAQAMQSVMNNVNYTLESISREMRYGTNYHCSTETSFSGSTLTYSACDIDTASPPAPDIQSIIFKSSKVDSTNPLCQLFFGYWFVKDNAFSLPRFKIKKEQQESCGDTISESTAFEIFDSSSITLTGYKLSISQPLTGFKYPWAMVGFTGYSGDKEKERNYFDVRTGVSQRMID